MISREAILHIPLSQYAYAASETQLTIRLRAARDNLQACTLYYGDRAHPTDPVIFTAIAMSVVASDELFDFYEITFEPDFNRVCYYFSMTTQGETILYYADLFSNEIPSTRCEYYQYPFIRREEISDVPDWFKKAIVYNIFPDSFANGKNSITCTKQDIQLPYGVICKSNLGGTLNGITENLPYIKNLGFNCIYINPIFTAGEYHKYDLIDYFHIDPCFGTDEDFAKLVDTAHNMNMRVIIDGVFNHCGRHFFAFEDVIKNGENSEYASWFYGLQFPVIIPENGSQPNYTCFAYEPKMPKLNTSNSKVRDYFLQVCWHWIHNYKIDGWRLDVANEVDKEFWRAFRRAAKYENPECVLIGEIWENSESWLKGDMFDSTMNYDFRKNCRDFFAEGKIDAFAFSSRITQMLMRYPKGIVDGQLNLLDSHDVSRFLSLCGDDERRFKLALLFLMLAPGVPNIFYGDELGVTGMTEVEYRQGMPWGLKSSLTAFFKQIIELRSNLAVPQGNYTVMHAAQMIYIVQRRHENSTITFLLNAGNSAETLSNLTLPTEKPLLSQGLERDCVKEFGYAVWLQQ